ncbi:MAG: ABC transporter ATP-binding protein [Acidimicrobiales bacterium]
MRPFVRTLAADDPRRLAWVVAVQVVAALAQGVGLVLLVPLVQVAGVSHASAGGLVGIARSIFAAVGVALTLRALLVVYVVLVAVTAALNAYESVLLVRYRLEFVDGLRRRLYRAIADAEWRHLLGLRQSDLLTALTVDVNWVGQATLASLNLGAAVIVIAAQVAVALRISPPVTALAALTATMLAALVWPLVGRSRRLGAELVEHNRGVLASVTGFLDGLKLAKTHGLEPDHVSNFETSMGRARRSQVEFAKAQATSTAVQLAVTALVLATLVEVAVDQLGIGLAELLVLAFIFTRLVPQITQAQQNVHTVAQALPAFDQLMGVIDDCQRAAEDSVERRRPRLQARGASGTLRDRVELDAVAFSYRRAQGQPVDVLHGVSLVLRAHTTTALVGASGAGKTTVADLVVGLLRPTSGVVTIDGEPLVGEVVARWRNAVATVPQEPFLFHDTIRANLAWAQRHAEERDMWQALSMASAEDFVRVLPHGLDTIVGDRGARLSGGERQRIALARALLREPELLVLDEATTSIDAANEAAILDALAILHGRVTMLVIAHQHSALRNADQVVTLADGYVVDVASATAGGAR